MGRGRQAGRVRGCAAAGSRCQVVQLVRAMGHSFSVRSMKSPSTVRMRSMTGGWRSQPLSMPLRKWSKNRLLQTDSVVGVELRPVLAAVDLQPLRRRCRPHEPLHIAPQMSPGAAPVARRQERHRDPVKHRRTLPMKTVVERMAPHIGAVVRSVRGEFLVGQRFRAGDELPAGRAHEAAFAQPVLHRGDRAPIPHVDGLAEHPTVVEHVAVKIADALPRNHRGQVGWVQAGHQPLSDRVVADAEQADLAGAPRLGARPLDAVVHVPGAAHRVRIDVAR